jgi:hypothetical protein
MINTLRKIVLTVLAIFFLLSSASVIDIIDYKLLVNFFGLNDNAYKSNVKYSLILGYIFILSIIISAIFDLIGRKNSNASTITKKISGSLGKSLNSVKNNTLKTLLGLFLTLIFQQFFIKIGIFKCTRVSIIGGWSEYCGSEKELIFLALAMIFFIFAITPKNIGEKIE